MLSGIITESEYKEKLKEGQDPIEQRAEIESEARENSKEGYVQHVNFDKENKEYYVSDWYDSDETVASYQNGELLESFTNNKQQLDENFVGIGMVGNIFDREKEKYEDAFEHFLSERFEEKVEENYATEVRDAWPSLSIDDRVSLLLTVFDDPDMAEEMAEKDFNELPEAAKSNMRMDMLEEGELNEGRTDVFRNILEKVYNDAQENIEYEESYPSDRKPFREYWEENKGEFARLLNQL
jgi:hypothetical protein